MRYRTDIGINECTRYVDIFWLIFFFLLLRIIFEVIWAATINDNPNFRNFNNSWWARWLSNRDNASSNLNFNNNLNNMNNLNNLNNLNDLEGITGTGTALGTGTITGTNGFGNLGSFNENWFYDWSNWFRWRVGILAVITEAIIGFIIALFYLIWQSYSYPDTNLCFGEEAVLHRGLTRNSIALLISAIALVIAQWYYTNYNFGNQRKIIVRNRIRDNTRILD